MSIWSKFYNVVTARSINRKINQLIKNEDAILHSCDALGDQIGLFLRCIMKATIKQADAQRETTIDFYIKNEDGIRKINEGIKILATKENADIIVKSFNELDDQEGTVIVEQNATAMERAGEVFVDMVNDFVE